MAKSDRNHPEFSEYVKTRLEDPREAEAYLNLALDSYAQDGNTAAFLLALRNVAKARGGISNLSRQTDLARESLYRTLSKNGNPRLDTLGLILKQVGLKLMVKREETVSA